MPKDTTTKRNTVPHGPVKGLEPRLLDGNEDDLARAFLALASEVYVLRERLHTLEAALAANGTLAGDAVERVEEDAALRAAREGDAKAYAARVLRQFHRSREPLSRVGRRES